MKCHVYNIIPADAWDDCAKGPSLTLSQCTLAGPVSMECHWNATCWPSVHWDTTGRPTDYLQGTLEHHWKNLVETAPHSDATGETPVFAAYTETPLEGL